MALYAATDISWTWANGIHDSMEAGEIRILPYPVATIQNQSDSQFFNFIGMAISWESTDSITGLGQALRSIQSDAINGTGSAINPFGSIQSAINFATTTGDSVTVAAGTYVENINFRGRNIKLVGQDMETTIIDGNQNGRVVMIDNQENSELLLKNFTIQKKHLRLPLKMFYR